MGSRERSTRNVLVTGGAGYIGSHTSKSLALSGFCPIAYDDLSTGHASAVRWGRLVEADIGDVHTVANTIREHRISCLIHFAASAYVGESVVNPRKYYRNNLTKAIAMLDCALEQGIDTVIFSSTCATYGVPERLPITEEHPQRPISPYGDSKLAFERVLSAYGEAYGLKWVSLRYFNAAGADPDGEIGERHDPETHLIPLALGAAFPGERPLRIFGTDYPTPDGTAIRDYIHVTDLGNAHVKALAYLNSGQPSRAFNLGMGTGHSVAQVIATVESVTGRQLSIETAPRRRGDPAELVADANLACRQLEWRPQHSTLSEIVSTAWRWECLNREETGLSLLHAASR